MSLGTFLFNDGPVDIGVDPGVQFLSIKSDPLHSNTELADVGANGFVELSAAHTQVGRRCIRSKDSGRTRVQMGRALLCCCWHDGLPPRCPDPCCKCWLLPIGQTRQWREPWRV